MTTRDIARCSIALAKLGEQIDPIVYCSSPHQTCLCLLDQTPSSGTRAQAPVEMS